MSNRIAPYLAKTVYQMVEPTRFADAFHTSTWRKLWIQSGRSPSWTVRLRSNPRMRSLSDTTDWYAYSTSCRRSFETGRSDVLPSWRWNHLLSCAAGKHTIVL